MMMPVNDPTGADVARKLVDDRKTVGVGARRLVRHQDVDAINLFRDRPQGVNIFGEDGHAVPTRDAAPPTGRPGEALQEV
jgi:hypothetical protein